MQIKKYVLGLFPDEKQTATAIKALEATQWVVDRVHSPFPSHKIFEALKLKPSPVGYFTLTGGILGFFTGFLLAIYTAVQWNLIVWGKPIVAWIPFVIVGFEFTVLFSVFGNVIGLLIQTRLPEFKSLEQYDPRCSADHFGIVVSCDEREQGQLIEFFNNQGGEVTIFD